MARVFRSPVVEVLLVVMFVEGPFGAAAVIAFVAFEYFVRVVGAAVGEEVLLGDGGVVADVAFEGPVGEVAVTDVLGEHGGFRAGHVAEVAFVVVDVSAHVVAEKALAGEELRALGALIRLHWKIKFDN